MADSFVVDRSLIVLVCRNGCFRLVCQKRTIGHDLPVMPSLVSSFDRLLIGLVMLASTALISGSMFADEPSLHQVSQAAEAGKLTEAQAMMHEVLSTRPNSGKAHFVEAELFVKQGQLAKAETELATAERLAPGLPFAKPQAVQNLRAQLGSSRLVRSVESQQFQPLPQAAHESPLPWGMLLLGASLIAFIAFAARFMAQRNASPAASGGAVFRPWFRRCAR